MQARDDPSRTGEPRPARAVYWHVWQALAVAVFRPDPHNAGWPGKRSCVMWRNSNPGPVFPGTLRALHDINPGTATRRDWPGPQSCTLGRHDRGELFRSVPSDYNPGAAPAHQPFLQVSGLRRSLINHNGKLAKCDRNDLPVSLANRSCVNYLRSACS